jgi:hypothetical protein
MPSVLSEFCIGLAPSSGTPQGFAIRCVAQSKVSLQILDASLLLPDIVVTTCDYWKEITRMACMDYCSSLTGSVGTA